MKNQYENGRPAPDCGSCWRRDTCTDAEAGRFCTLWATEDPAKKPREKGPAEKWSEGEEDWI